MRKKEIVEIPADHKCDWKEKWDNTYRECVCGRRQWHIACWTGNTWTKKAPEHLFAARPDVSRDVNKMPTHMAWVDHPHLIRQYAILPMHTLNTPITVIGVGAIGSLVMLALSKMGFTALTVYDPDVVKPENYSCQLYGHNNLGRNKAADIERMLGAQGYLGVTGRNPIKVNSVAYATDPLSGIVICAVDNMAARKVIWEKQKGRREVDFFIDARMGAEQALMYVMNPTNARDVKAYEKTLYDDADAIQEPCTAAATMYTSLLIGGMVAKAVKDLVTDFDDYPRILQWDIKNNKQTVTTKADTKRIAQWRDRVKAAFAAEEKQEDEKETTAI